MIFFQVLHPYVYALQDQVFQNFIQRKLKHLAGLLTVSNDLEYQIVFELNRSDSFITAINMMPANIN